MIVSEEIHPLRWRNTRPFANKSIQFMQGELRGNHIVASTIQKKMNWLIPHFNDAIMRLPRSMRPDQRVLQKELNVSLYATRFFNLGRNIFTISPGLAEALSNTDLEGVRIGDIKYPQPFFYVSLHGLCCGSLPGSPNEIDGAYVDATIPEIVQIAVTSRRLDCSPKSSRTWPLNRDAYFYFTSEAKDGDNPTFAQLFERAVLKGDIKVDTISELPQSNELIEDSSTVFDEDRNDPRVVQWRDVSRHNDRVEAVENGRALDSIMKALSMVVNALAWLSAEPDDADVTSAWPADAPAGLVQAVSRSDRRSDSKKADQELRRRGFARIRILGASVRIIDHLDGDGQELRSAHWRRGHWRRQPHGVGNKMIKLLWIKPVVVRPDLPIPTDDGGHEYVLGA